MRERRHIEAVIAIGSKLFGTQSGEADTMQREAAESKDNKTFSS
jgi:hypothetical protein